MLLEHACYGGRPPTTNSYMNQMCYNVLIKHVIAIEEVQRHFIKRILPISITYLTMSAYCSGRVLDLKPLALRRLYLV